ncbi:MAG: leucine--tRNA ligase [Thermoplasmata archaeon]
MKDYGPVEIEEKWQNRWETEGVDKAEVDYSREPFYLIFAYPGVSGFLHLGHMRCYSYTDMIARYKRMEGYNVLFPTGTHPTGNQAYSLSKHLQEGVQEKIDYMKRNGATVEDIERMKDPLELVTYFNEVYIEKYWKKFAISIDFDYFTYSIREDYKQFIRWQFKKLKEQGLLAQKDYFGTECIECGPVAVDPSETDLSKGGTAEKQEYTLLKFEHQGKYITAATLRPETVFGQTNLWVDPQEEYLIAVVDGEEWILSKEAVEKLKYQKDHVTIVDTIKGEDMIGDYAAAPVIHREIIILPASFTDPNVGTGIVTSVPSDAPYDWIALRDLKEDEELLEKYGLKEKIKEVEPIPIIESKDWGINSAEKIIDEMGIESQEEQDKLEVATQKIYKSGFHTGNMLDSCQDYSGLRVQQAKESVKQDMVEKGEADIMYDLSQEVICRCGAKVVVGKIPDQWFIRYSDEELTEKSKKHAEKMEIKPQNYADNIPETLAWFQDRSCARKGNWLGTEFPFDEEWVIEAIADSTLYPAYYVLAKHYNEGNIEADQMTEEFFDYVYLNRGDPGVLSETTGLDKKTIEKVRSDFQYWYPLDLNLGGKEHMTVHFPPFLMNHVGIMNEGDWPRGIFVNWWLVGKGGKISKSKGGAEPIPDAAEKYGVDTLRLFYAHSASPFVDKEWDEDEVFNYRRKLNSIWSKVHRMKETDGDKKPVDDYLRSRFYTLVNTVKEHMQDYELRKAVSVVYYDIPSEIDWYFKRDGENRELMKEVAVGLLKLMVSFTPHIAEELSEFWGVEYIVNSTLPEVPEDAISKEAESREEYIKDVLADIKQILDIADVPGDRIHLYVAPEWKERAMNRILESPDMSIMKELTSELDTPPKQISGFVRQVLKILREKGAKDSWHIPMDEYEVLKNSSDFLEKEFQAEIKVYPSGDTSYDPAGKASYAMPRKPAIYVE